jgi:hypothetical protein
LVDSKGKDGATFYKISTKNIYIYTNNVNQSDRLLLIGNFNARIRNNITRNVGAFVEMIYPPQEGAITHYIQ